jgi:hypothetical protein
MPSSGRGPRSSPARQPDHPRDQLDRPCRIDYKAISLRPGNVSDVDPKDGAVIVYIRHLFQDVSRERVTMQRGTTVYVPCRLSRSGFSSERVFRVTQADTQEYVGAAPVFYCWTSDGRRLGPDTPAKNSPIDGLVEGYVLLNGGDRAKVEFPDGEVAEMMVADLHQEGSVKLEPYPDVPVGS